MCLKHLKQCIQMLLFIHIMNLLIKLVQVLMQLQNIKIYNMAYGKMKTKKVSTKKKTKSKTKKTKK